MLDNPAFAALTGPQAHLAVIRGRAARFLPDVAPFAGLPLDPGEADWADLAAIVEPGETVVLVGPPRVPPPGWEVLPGIDGVQMDGSTVQPARDPEALPLGPADVPEMIDLVERTRPGPFRKATIVTGRYLGIRRDGALVAMAGERMRLPGVTEVSAVCTDRAARGQGLAARLVRAVVASITERGDVPILHAAASNLGAIRLYEHLGFTHTRPMTFALLRLGPVHEP